MSLFCSKDSKVELVGYANAGYRSDLHKGRSQTGYIFTYGDTTTSWQSLQNRLLQQLLRIMRSC